MKRKYFLKTWVKMEIFQIIESWFFEHHTVSKLYFLMASLRYNLYTIKFIHFKCIIQCFLDYAQICTTITSHFRTLSLLQKRNPYLLVITPLTPHPQIPKQPVIYFLSLQIFLFWTFHMNRII